MDASIRTDPYFKDRSNCNITFEDEEFFDRGDRGDLGATNPIRATFMKKLGKVCQTV